MVNNDPLMDAPLITPLQKHSSNKIGYDLTCKGGSAGDKKVEHPIQA
jgi:hypothetical protein